MGLLVLFAWAVAAGAVADLAPARFGLDRHPPDLWVAMAAYLALRGAGVHGVRWAVLLGLLEDGASLDPLGTHGFVLGATTLLLARPPSSDRRPLGLTLPLTVACATVLARALYAVRCLPLHRDVPFLPTVLAGFPAALWTALATWPLLAALDRVGAVDDLLGRRRAAGP